MARIGPFRCLLLCWFPHHLSFAKRRNLQPQCVKMPQEFATLGLWWNGSDGRKARCLRGYWNAGIFLQGGGILKDLEKGVLFEGLSQGAVFISFVVQCLVCQANETTISCYIQSKRSVRVEIHFSPLNETETSWQTYVCHCLPRNKVNS